MRAGDARPRGPVELLAGGAQEDDGEALFGEAGGVGARDVGEDAEHADDGRRVDRRVRQALLGAGRVVQRHVAAGHGDLELDAAVRERGHGGDQLPHGVRVFGVAEVQAVRDGDGFGADDGDVTVGLGEGLAGSRCRVELGVPAVGVGRQGDAKAAFLVDADNARVVGLGEGGVALHVAVVLVGDPRLGGLVDVGEHGAHVGDELLARGGARKILGGGGLEFVLPRGARVGAVVDGALVGDGLRVDVDDAVTVMVDRQAAVAGQVTDDCGLDVPLVDDLEEALAILRGHDRHHAFLGLAHEDLARGERGVAQEHVLEVDVHAGVAVGGQLGGRARDARGTEVLDALDDVGLEQVEAALDEDLLHEGVAHLDGGALGGHAVFEGLGGEDGGAADAVAAGARAEEDDEVAFAGRVGQVDVVVAQLADAQRVDEGVALVGGVKLGFAADVGQAQAVAVAADAGDDAVDDARRVGVVDGAEAQLVHDGDRAGAHGDDVADDAAHAGGRALVGLDEGRVVVGLHLEGDGPAAADVDDAGVLAHADEEVLPHGVVRARAELFGEVLLGGFVGAVLGPHDGVHGEFGVGGSASEDVADALVFVLFEAEFLPGHVLVGGRGGVFDGVGQLAGVFGGHSCFHSKGLGRGRGSLTGEGAVASSADEGCEDGTEDAQAVGAAVVAGAVVAEGERAEAGFGRVLGVGHEADDVARGVGDARDVVGASVGVEVDVAEHDAAFALESFELGGGGLEVAFAVLEGHGDGVAGAVGTRPRGVRVFDAQHLVAAQELLVVVADERAGQEVRLAQDLEAVADAQDGQASSGFAHDFAHDGGSCGDRTAAQVVAVGEAAGDHDRVDAVQVGVLVPQGHGLGASDLHRAGGVAVIEGAREGDDSDAGHCAPPA